MKSAVRNEMTGVRQDLTGADRARTLPPWGRFRATLLPPSREGAVKWDEFHMNFSLGGLGGEHAF
jgi:hypothetical protein